MKTLAQQSREAATQPRSVASLWLVLLGPPVIWLSQFEVKYVLAARPQTARHSLLMIGVSVVALALIAVLAVLARRQKEEAAGAPLDVAAGVVGRNRFMARVGLMTCALFSLLIVAQGLADFFFEPARQ